MARHQHGGDIYTTSYDIDFSVNLNPLGMPQSIIDAACEGVRESINYPDVQCRELRRAVAEKEQVKESQIIFGNGAAELIFLLTEAIAPKKALLLTPGFAEYEQALQVQNTEIQYYPLKKENEFRLTEDYLAKLTDSLDVIFLCNPNNPTGNCIDQTLLLKVLDVCREKKIRAVIDLCFIDFLDDPGKADLSKMLEEYPNLIILKAFTKTYAMAGLRLGYALCSEQELLDRARAKTQPWNVSIPAQKAGVAALKETEYVEKTRALIGKERIWLTEQLREIGLTVYPADANFIFFEGPKGLIEKCRKHKILLRSCANYRGLCEGFYRIAVRTHEENETLVKILNEELKL